MVSKSDVVKFIKENSLLVIAAGLVILLLIVYFSVFAPLLGGLKAKYLEYKRYENSIRDARALIAYSKNIDKACGGRMLISEEEAATSIDNVTGHGKSLGINFTEIKPGNIVVKENPPYKILPIELKIECGGDQFVSFVASIDELKKAIVRIKSFNITPQKEDRDKLDVDMIIEIYLSSRAGVLR